jgi:hypothetical protein
MFWKVIHTLAAISLVLLVSQAAHAETKTGQCIGVFIHKSAAIQGSQSIAPEGQVIYAANAGEYGQEVCQYRGLCYPRAAVALSNCKLRCTVGAGYRDCEWVAK